MPTGEHTMADIEQFVAEHGRRPRRFEPSERSLAAWFDRVLDGTIRVTHEEAVRAYEIDDTYTARPVGTTDGVLQDLEDFIARTGRFPSLGSYEALFDLSPGERNLAGWARSVRSGKLLVSAEVRSRVAELAQQHIRRHVGKQKKHRPLPHRIVELRLPRDDPERGQSPL